MGRILQFERRYILCQFAAPKWAGQAIQCKSRNLSQQQSSHLNPKVKYWALGNEVYGSWQIEENTKEDYAKKAIQWAKAIKRLDPSVQLILCGWNGTSSWDYYVLKECITQIDMHSIHIYTAASEHMKNVTGLLSKSNSCYSCIFIDFSTSTIFC
jgi:alpha-L-arabinofuranosidase